MMKIYTKTGDSGETGLFGGARVKKSDIRLEAYGTVDELNSNLGMLHNYPEKFFSSSDLQKIQSDLFVIGSILAKDPDKNMSTPVIMKSDVTFLENKIDYITEDLPQLKSFVLPSGNTPASYCHIARTVCRRAERAVVHLHEYSSVESLIFQYLNRLSDFLFVLARKFVIHNGDTEIPWIPSK